jgi:hypothetical protein
MKSKKDILSMSTDRKPKRLPVPEWDGVVYVRVMTGTQARACINAVRKVLSEDPAPDDSEEVANATIVQHGIQRTAKAGAPLMFGADDLQQLARLDWNLLDRLASMVCASNGLFGHDKAEKDAEKN